MRHDELIRCLHDFEYVYRAGAHDRLDPKVVAEAFRLAANALEGVTTLAVRPDAPGTTRKAAKNVLVRAGSQRHQLLRTYLAGDRTDEEAGQAAGLRRPGCAYWMRCSELRQAGYIQPLGLTRTASTGEQQQVCAITDEGRMILGVEGLANAG